MPSIPRTRRTQVVRAPGVVPVDPTPQVLGARSLQNIGQGIVNFSKGLADFQARRAADARRIRLQEFELKFQNAFIDTEKESEDKIKEDGSDSESVSLEIYDKKSKEIIDQFDGDDTTRDELVNLSDKFKVNLRQRAIDRGRDMGIRNTDAQVERSINAHANIVRNNPEIADLQSEQMSEFVDSIELFSPDKKQKIKEIGFRDIALSAVNGFIDKKKFDEAEDLAKLAFPNIDAAQRESLLDEIEAAKFSQQSNEIKAKKQALELDKLEREEQSQKLFNDLTQRSQAALLSGDKKQVMDILEQAQSAVGQGILKRSEAQFVINVASGRNRNSVLDGLDSDLEFTFVEKILSPGQDLGRVRKEIVLAQNQGRLLPDTSIRLLKSLDQEKEERRAGSKNSELVKASNELMDAAFGKDAFDVLMDSSKRRIKAEAMAFRANLIENGMNRMTATKTAIERFKRTTDIATLRVIPGIENASPQTKQETRKAAVELKVLLELDQINRKTYNKRMMILKQISDDIDVSEKLRRLSEEIIEQSEITDGGN